DGAPREVNLSEKERGLLYKDIENGRIGQGFSIVQSKVFVLLLTNLFPIFEIEYEPFKVSPKNRGGGDKESDISLASDNHKKDKIWKDKSHHNKKEKGKTPLHLNIHGSHSANNGKFWSSRSPILRQKSLTPRSRETSPVGENEFHMLNFLNMAPRSHNDPNISKAKSPRQHELDLINHYKLLAQFEQQENQLSYAAAVTRQCAPKRPRESCKSDNPILHNTRSDNFIGLSSAPGVIGTAEGNEHSLRPNISQTSNADGGETSSVWTYTDPKRKELTYEVTPQSERADKSDEFGVDAYSNLFRDMGIMVDVNTVVHSQKARGAEDISKTVGDGDSKSTRKSLRGGQPLELRATKSDIDRVVKGSSYHHSHDLADANVLEDRHLSALEDECFGERSRIRMHSLGARDKNGKMISSDQVGRITPSRKNSQPRTLADASETTIARRLHLRKSSLVQLAQRMINTSPRDSSPSKPDLEKATSMDSPANCVISSRSVLDKTPTRISNNRGKLVDTPCNSPFSPVPSPGSAPVVMGQVFSYAELEDGSDSGGDLRMEAQGRARDQATDSPHRVQGGTRNRMNRRSSCSVIKPSRFCMENRERVPDGDVLQELLHRAANDTDMGLSATSTLVGLTRTPVCRHTSQTNSSSPGVERKQTGANLSTPRRRSNSPTKLTMRANTLFSRPETTCQAPSQHQPHEQHQHIKQRQQQLQQLRDQQPHQEAGGTLGRRVFTGDFDVGTRFPIQTRSMGSISNTPLSRGAGRASRLEGKSTGSLYNPNSAPEVDASFIYPSSRDRLILVTVSEGIVGHQSSPERQDRMRSGGKGAVTIQRSSSLSSIQNKNLSWDATTSTNYNPTHKRQCDADKPKLRIGNYQTRTSPIAKERYNGRSGPNMLLTDAVPKREPIADSGCTVYGSTMPGQPNDEETSVAGASDAHRVVHATEMSCSEGNSEGQPIIDEGADTVGVLTTHLEWEKQSASGAGSIQRPSDYMIRSLYEPTTTDEHERAPTEGMTAVLSDSADSQLSESTVGLGRDAFRPSSMDDLTKLWPGGGSSANLKPDSEESEQSEADEPNSVYSAMAHVIGAPQDLQLIGNGERSPRIVANWVVPALDSLTITPTLQTTSVLSANPRRGSPPHQVEDGLGCARKVSSTGDSELNGKPSRALSIPCFELTDDEGIISRGVSTEELGLSGMLSDISSQINARTPEPDTNPVSTKPLKEKFALSQSLSDSFVGLSTRTTHDQDMDRDANDDRLSLDEEILSAEENDGSVLHSGRNEFAEGSTNETVSPFSMHRFLEKSAQMSGSEKLDLLVRMHPESQAVEPTSSKSLRLDKSRPRRAMSGKTISLHYKNKKKLKEMDLEKFKGSHSHEVEHMSDVRHSHDVRSDNRCQTLATTVSESKIHSKNKDKYKSTFRAARARKLSDKKYYEDREKGTSPTLLRMLTHRYEKKRRKSGHIVSARTSPNGSGELQESSRKISEPSSNNDLARVNKTPLSTDSVDILLGDALTCQLQEEEEVDK
ncbi:hypothetical protein SARC_07665, partial [Sphaeroforma arctica JP610]